MRISLKKKIISAGALPIFLLGLLSIIITVTMVQDSLIDEVKESLKGTAAATLAAYEQNSGEYLQAANGDIWRGGYNISKSENLVDSIKANSGMDVTFFYGSQRIMTSAVDKNGDRILGSPAGDIIIEKVLQGGEEYFSEGVSLDGVLNYGYYIPVYQKGDNDSPIGMIFVGTSKEAKDRMVNRILFTITGVVGVVMMICILATFLLSSSVTASLRKSIGLVQTVAKGELSVEPDKKLLTRKDEIGDLSVALKTLQEELKKILIQIDINAKEILHTSDSLDITAKETVQTMHDVENAVIGIAQSSDEQARNSVTASENVQRMGERIMETSKEVESLNATADGMSISSKKAAETMKRLHEINGDVRKSIDMITKQTNETNEAVQKIREAAEIITSIAEETNLLSLNASIEAARAGEHGRGFAVVASQIQKLAEQSNEASSSIEEIIKLLIYNSDEAVEAMKQVQTAINSQNGNLEDTEQIVTEVAQGIDRSLHSIGQIGNSTRQLQEEREEVIGAVKELVGIAEHNASNTEETSAITNEVSTNFEKVAESAEKLKEIAREMAGSMQHFRI